MSAFNDDLFLSQFHGHVCVIDLPEEKLRSKLSKLRSFYSSGVFSGTWHKIPNYTIIFSKMPNSLFIWRVLKKPQKGLGPESTYVKVSKQKWSASVKRWEYNSASNAQFCWIFYPIVMLKLIESRQCKNDFILSKIIPTLKLPLFFSTCAVREKHANFKLGIIFNRMEHMEWSRSYFFFALL